MTHHARLNLIMTATIIVLIVTNIWAIAVAMESAKQTKRELDLAKDELRKTRETIEGHLRDTSIHRTLDSEGRINRIEAGISAIGNILTDIKENIGMLRASNKN